MMAPDTILRRGPSGDLFHVERFERLPNGSRRSILEIERRKSDIDAIPADHPLKDIIRRCLDNDSSRRPTAASLRVELLQIAQNLGIDHKDHKDHIACRLAANQRLALSQQSSLQRVEDRLREASNQLSRKDERIANSNSVLRATIVQKRELEGVLASRDSSISQLQETVASQDMSISRLEDTVASRDASILRLEETLDEVLRSPRVQSTVDGKNVLEK